MNKKVLLISAMLISKSLMAQFEQQADSLKTIGLEEIIVSTTRAGEKTPVAYSNLSKQEIESRNIGQDMPYLLNFTPSLVTTSDAGAGVGYTGMRIRGSDATRVNITINGIPYNDAESQGTFWVNMPDFSSSTNSIQIQRGVGTSTNGAGAFGASVNLETSIPSPDSFVEVNNTIGSFGTRKHNVILNSGLIDDKWSFEGRLSQISSDGFVDRSEANLKSYYLSGSYIGNKTTVKALAFGGKEITHQAWYGTPKAVINGDADGIEDVIGYNGITGQRAENLRNDGRTFNWYTYENEVDNYSQDHYQLHLNQEVSDQFSFNISGHYTYGRGFFEQFREDDDFKSYGLSNIIYKNESLYSDNDFVSEGTAVNSSFGSDLTIDGVELLFTPILDNGDSIRNVDGAILLNALAQTSKGDFIRRRWLDNDFYGFTYGLNYETTQLSMVLGGGYHYYSGDHFGEIIWAQLAGNTQLGDRYYESVGVKKDFNTFLKANYQLNDKFNLFGDLQIRKVDYNTVGVDSDLRNIDIGDKYTFFNPKFGLTYELSANANVYASYAIGNREPDRNDFVDSPTLPQHESLRDLEIGYRRTTKNYSVELNFYNMSYDNQLVLTGALNDVGSNIRTNVPSSYRRGVELSGGIQLSEQIKWNANITFSKNKIQNFTEVLYDYGAAFDEFNVIENGFEDSDIAFSPNVVAGSNFSFSPVKSFKISLLSKYVGKQFLDNTSNDNRKINSYFVNDLQFSANFKTKFIKEIGLNLLINNVLNHEYESNGYTFGYSGGPDFVVRENYLYPQAGRNFLLALKLRF